jgi:hypothetical protein
MLATATPANAWTTMAEIRSNGVLRGKIWYNAGTHNLSKGRNSFTVKDEYCADGIAIRVYWSHPYGSGYRTANCGEISFSTTNNLPVPLAFIRWYGSAYVVSSGGNVITTPTRTDYVY